MRQVLLVFAEHFSNHFSNLSQGEFGYRQRIVRDGLVHKFSISLQTTLNHHHFNLGAEIGEDRTGVRERTDLDGGIAAAGGENRHLHTGPFRKVGDETVVVDVAVEFEQLSAETCVDYRRRILVTSLQGYGVFVVQPILDFLFPRLVS